MDKKSYFLGISNADSCTTHRPEDIDTLDDIVIKMSLQHVIINVNKATCDFLGLPAEHIIGSTCCQIFHGTDIPPADCPLNILRQLPSPQSVSVNLNLRDRVFRVTGTPIFDSKGNIISASCAAKDMSLNKRAGSEIERINRALITLSECNKILSQASTEKEMLQNICRVIVEEGGYQLAWIGFAHDDTEKTVFPVARWGYADNYLDCVKIAWADNNYDQGPTGTAIRTSQPVICRNLTTDPKFIPWQTEAKKRGYTSSISLPLTLDGKTSGALNIYATEIYSFKDQELGLLQGLASQISYGIITRRLEQERKKAASELAKNFQVINQIKEAVITTDLSGIITSWNNGASELFGYSPNEAMGENISALLLLKKSDPIHEEYINSPPAMRVQWEAPVLHKLGNPFHALLSASILLNHKNEKEGTIFTVTDISDRKAAEIKLQESEERYRLLIENTSDWIWEVDEKGNFTYTSHKVKELLGYDPEELIGTSAFNLMYEEKEAIRVADVYDEILVSGEPFTFKENINRHRDGHIVVLESCGVPIFDAFGKFRGYRGVDRDITARKEIEKNRENQAIIWALGSDIGQAVTTEKKLHDMLKNCCESFIKRLNVGFARIWLYQPLQKMLILEGSAGIHDDNNEVHDRLHIESQHKISQIAATRMPHLTNQVTGYPEIEDREWLQKNNIIAFAGHPLLVGEKLIGVMAIFSCSPLTDFILKTFGSVADKIAIGIGNKLAEQEKNALQMQVRQMQKLQAIGTLAGGIAHDFNNILTAILGFSDLLKSLVKNDPDSLECIEQVLQAGNRAKNLVKQILTFSRRTEQTRHSLQPHLVVKEAVKLLIASIPSNIQIRQYIDPGCGNIMADPTELHQIIMNLCTNAYQAMQGNGGILKIHLKQIPVGQDLTRLNPRLYRGLYIRLRVQDTGCGMDRMTLERIFEPYYTTKQLGEGTGLGLALVHGIVEGLGGAIVVESTPGQGSTFDVYLPLLKATESETLMQEEELISGGNERILFVDDESAIVSFNQRQLHNLGYNITATTSSRDALNLFSSSPQSFDLVITDQMMPGLTGTELSKKLLTIRSDIPIILVTGFSQDIIPDQAKNLGIKEFAMKPILINELAPLIRKALKKN